MSFNIYSSQDRPGREVRVELRTFVLYQKGFRYFPIRMVLRAVQDTNPERIGIPVGPRVGLSEMIPHRGVLGFIERVPNVLIESQAHRTLRLTDIT